MSDILIYASILFALGMFILRTFFKTASIKLYIWLTEPMDEMRELYEQYKKI